MDPLAFLIYLLIGVVIVAIIWYAMLWVGVPQPPARIILLIVILLFLFWFIQKAGYIHLLQAGTFV